MTGTFGMSYFANFCDINFSADSARRTSSPNGKLPIDLRRMHSPRPDNLDASLHFAARISYDSLLIAGPAVYGLNRAIPND